MRIIAGKHRGMVLFEFDSDNIRPTADRVRESIFNKLQFSIPDADVLDLFGGTGAISLEFISRGASSVITVDNNINSINLIKKNFAKAREKENLINLDFLSALDRLKNSKFDIVFLDPPFATNYGKQALDKIRELNILEDDGVIVYEHSADTSYELCSGLKLLDSKKYGTIMVDYIGVVDV